MCCVIQGVQKLGGKAIIYSGGSFIDDYAVDEEFRNNLSCIWLATFSLTASSSSSSRATEVSGQEQQETAAVGTAAQLEDNINTYTVRCYVPAASDGAAAAAAALQTEVVGGLAARGPEPARLAAAPVELGLGVAAGAAAAAAGTHNIIGSTSSRLQLQRLVAVPISIQHHWRRQGAEEGPGLPPYVPEVLTGCCCQPSCCVMVWSNYFCLGPGQMMMAVAVDHLVLLTRHGSTQLCRQRGAESPAVDAAMFWVIVPSVCVSAVNRATTCQRLVEWWQPSSTMAYIMPILLWQGSSSIQHHPVQHHPAPYCG